MGMITQLHCSQATTLTLNYRRLICIRFIMNIRKQYAELIYMKTIPLTCCVSAWNSSPSTVVNSCLF